MWHGLISASWALGRLAVAVVVFVDFVAGSGLGPGFGVLVKAVVGIVDHVVDDSSIYGT